MLLVRSHQLDHAIRDAQYALRVLRRAPVFAAVAILSLAFGIGANAAIFQLIDTVSYPKPAGRRSAGAERSPRRGRPRVRHFGGLQCGRDASALGADSRASDCVRLDVCLGECAIACRPRRRGAADARAVGEWRFLPRAGHHAGARPPAQGRRRSPRMRRRGGGRQSRVLADAAWRSRRRHRQHAHDSGSAVHRRRRHAGAVHRASKSASRSTSRCRCARRPSGATVSIAATSGG